MVAFAGRFPGVERMREDKDNYNRVMVQRNGERVINEVEESSFAEIVEESSFAQRVAVAEYEEASIDELFEIDTIRYQYGVYYRAAADYILLFGPKVCKALLRYNAAYRRAVQFVTGVSPTAADLGPEIFGIACDILPQNIVVDVDRLMYDRFSYAPAVTYNLLTVGGHSLCKRIFVSDIFYRQAAILVLGCAAKQQPTIPVLDHEEEEEEEEASCVDYFHNPFATQYCHVDSCTSSSFIRKPLISEVSVTVRSLAATTSFCKPSSPVSFESEDEYYTEDPAESGRGGSPKASFDECSGMNGGDEHKNNNNNEQEGRNHVVVVSKWGRGAFINGFRVIVVQSKKKCPHAPQTFKAVAC